MRQLGWNLIGSSTGNLTSWTWIACGLLPFLAAVAAEALVADATMIQAPREDSPLLLTQHAVNLGPVGPHPFIEGHFEFQNRGEVPLTIESVHPSCGCLKWHLHRDQMTYAPGESGRLTLRLMTANEQPGPHGYTVELAWKGAERKVSSLLFRATLPEKKLLVEPHELIFMQLHGEPDERIIHVTDYRTLAESCRLTLEDIECSSPDVSLEILPAVRNESGHTSIPIRVSVPAEVAPGRQIASLRIKTNDADFPLLGLPVLLEGRTGRRIHGPSLPPIRESAPIAQKWPGYRLDTSPPPRSTIQQTSHETVIR